MQAFRRGLARGLAALAPLALIGAAAPESQPLNEGGVMAAVERLRPGQYLWAPQIAPEGPVLLVVNLQTQRMVIYRNGVPIGVTTVSTGRAGHRTPVGIFTILQKRPRHFSNIYNNAPMPFMQRLTWTGIALHGGALPGYPASHGCIRLPHSFARDLFQHTALGMTVVITNQADVPRIAPTPDLLSRPMMMVSGGNDFVWMPNRSPTGPVSIVVSAADRRVTVLRDGQEIGSAPVRLTRPVVRPSAFTMIGMNGDRGQWLHVPLPGQAAAGPGDAFAGISVDPRFQAAMAGVLAPGTTIVVTPDSMRRGAAADAPLMLLEADMAGIFRDERVTGG